MTDLEEELDSGLRWLDLIAPPPGRTGPQHGTSPYKIRCVVGYNEPNPRMWETFGIRREEFNSMSNAIKHAKISLYLNIVKHELTLMDGGGIELSLEYFAALEGILSDTRADVLLLGLTLEERETVQTTGQDGSTEEHNAAQRENRQRLSEARCERDRAEEGSEERERQQEAMDAISETMDELEKARENEQGARYRKLLDILEETGRVFKIKVKAEDLGRLNKRQMQERDSARLRSRTAATRSDILNQLQNTNGERPNLGGLRGRPRLKTLMMTTMLKIEVVQEEMQRMMLEATLPMIPVEQMSLRFLLFITETCSMLLLKFSSPLQMVVSERTRQKN